MLLKKKFLILISCLFISGCHQKPKQVASDFDSFFDRKDSLDLLSLNLSNKKYDTLIRSQLSILAEKYRINLSAEKYFKISKVIESKSTFIKDTFGILKGKSNIGAYYYNKFTLDSAYLFVYDAEKISNKTKKNYF